MSFLSGDSGNRVAYNLSELNSNKETLTLIPHQMIKKVRGIRIREALSLKRINASSIRCFHSTNPARQMRLRYLPVTSHGLEDETAAIAFDQLRVFVRPERASSNKASMSPQSREVGFEFSTKL